VGFLKTPGFCGKPCLSGPGTLGDVGEPAGAPGQTPGVEAEAPVVGGGVVFRRGNVPSGANGCPYGCSAIVLDLRKDSPVGLVGLVDPEGWRFGSNGDWRNGSVGDPLGLDGNPGDPKGVCKLRGGTRGGGGIVGGPFLCSSWSLYVCGRPAACEGPFQAPLW
jgi:hypothetical protein